jgi:hypothetical protein
MWRRCWSVESFGRAAGALLEAPGDDELERADYRAIVETVGYFAKLPTKQVWRSGEYFYDWLTGEQDPEGVGEGLWRLFVTGAPRS